MTQSMNESMSEKGVCRTAPATSGLLIMYYLFEQLRILKKYSIQT